MKIYTKISIYVVVFLFLVSGFIYQCFPVVVDWVYQVKNFRETELSIHRFSIEGDIFEYAEGGNGKEVVLLLHGFQSDKRAYLPYVKYLKDFHIIIPDFSGHGGSSDHKNQHYDLKSLSHSLYRFVDHLHLDKVHLVGNSMGGGIALYFSLYHPERVLRVVLINPLGVNPPIKSYFQNVLDRGKNLLFPNNLQEFDDFGRLLIGHPFDLSIHFKEYVLHQLLKKRFFYNRVFNELVSSETLDDKLDKIKSQVLILAGQRDLVLHPTSYEVFHKKLPKNKYVKINAPHALMGEYLKEASEEIASFLRIN